MTRTTYRPSARRLAEIADNSQRQADLYRKMADALLTVTANPEPGTVVAIEVDRMLNLADEFDGDAEENREAALAAGYEPADA